MNFYPFTVFVVNGYIIFGVKKKVVASLVATEYFITFTYCGEVFAFIINHFKGTFVGSFF